MSIYVLSKGSKSDEYKIGKHSGTKEKLVSRYITAIPDLIIHHFIQVEDHKVEEKRLHSKLSKYRTKNANGNLCEWFQCPLSVIEQHLKCSIIPPQSKGDFRLYDEQWLRFFSKLGWDIIEVKDCWYSFSALNFYRPLAIVPYFSRKVDDEIMKTSNQKDMEFIFIRNDFHLSILERHVPTGYKKSDKHAEREMLWKDPVDAQIFKCSECKKWSIMSEYGSYHCRANGCYDGDHHISEILQ